jgi:hypothetical protein
MNSITPLPKMTIAEYGAMKTGVEAYVSIIDYGDIPQGLDRSRFC